MCYRIEFTLPDGTVRYLDSKSREASEPYHWANRSAAMNIIKTLKRGKSNRVNYICVDEELEKVKAAASPKANENAVKTVGMLGDACRIICSEVSNLQNTIKTETDKIAREDRVTQDILHYIELNDCSEAMAVQLVGMLKKARQRRRESKDAVMLLSAIRDNISPQTAESICNAADTLIDRKYSPRELPDLFSDTCGGCSE